MTRRAIQGNIQFEGGGIVPPCGRANTATLELNIPLYCPTQKECNSNLVGKKMEGEGKRKKRERGKKVRAGVSNQSSVVSEDGTLAYRTASP